MSEALPAPSAPLAPPEKPKRRAISKKTRFDVFKRDGFRCMYCGAHPPAVVLQVDHIIAVSQGGRNTIDNLVTACQPCNLGKGAADLRVAPQSLAELAADTAEREAQLAGYAAVMEEARRRLDADVWRVFDVLFGPTITSVSHDEYGSLKRFVEKLGVHGALDAAEITLASPGVHYSNRFRYFCGVCWNKIREAN